MSWAKAGKPTTQPPLIVSEPCAEKSDTKIGRVSITGKLPPQTGHRIGEKKSMPLTMMSGFAETDSVAQACASAGSSVCGHESSVNGRPGVPAARSAPTPPKVSLT